MAQRDTLLNLLNYVEQVVRLDERVPLRLDEYRLPDKSRFIVQKGDTQDLPGVQHNVINEEGPRSAEGPVISAFVRRNISDGT